MDELQEIAYHEAAHAAVSHVLGKGFKYVTIIPDEAGESLGHLLNEPFSEEFREAMEAGAGTAEEAELEGHILSLYAGGMAGEKVSGTYSPDGCNSDNHQIVNLASHVWAGPALDSYLGRLESQARHLVERCWPAIEALAAELLKRETLTAAEVGAIADPLLPGLTPREALRLEARLLTIDADLRELRREVIFWRRALLVPAVLVDWEGQRVGEITAEAEIQKHTPPIWKRSKPEEAGPPEVIESAR